MRSMSEHNHRPDGGVRPSASKSSVLSTSSSFQGNQITKQVSDVSVDWYRKFPSLFGRSGARIRDNDKGKMSTMSRRYMSNFSLDSIDDDESTEFRTVSVIPDISGGSIRFTGTAHEQTQAQNFLLMDKTTNMSDVINYIAVAWKIRVPEVVLSIISSQEYSCPWVNASHVVDFQIGLIQAARLTKMWILSEGVGAGIANILGEAAAEEMLRRQVLENDQDENIYPELVLLGLLPLEILHNKTTFVEKANIGRMSLATDAITFKYQFGPDRLQPQHTHYLLMKSSEDSKMVLDLNNAFNIESRFIQYINSKERSDDDAPGESYDKVTPVVGLLIQGGPREIDRVLWLLKRQIPVIVFAVKGFAAGLIAYVFNEGLKGDPQYIDNIIQPQLLQRVGEAFPELMKAENDFARLQCRDKVLECVKYAVQGRSRYLTIMDPTQDDFDYKDLSKFILSAIIAAHQQEMDDKLHFRSKITHNLRLALSWNRPDVASNWILNQMNIGAFRVRDELFMEALTLPDREEFIDLFLRLGFPLRRFMTRAQLHRLYGNAVNKEFFASVCLQKILGYKKPVVPSDFIVGVASPLNRLLCFVSGLSKLTKTSDEFLVMETPADKATAEKKALLELLFWSVLTRNTSLAKVLWRRSSEPIAVALMVSNMFYRLSKHYITELDLKVLLKQEAVNFGKLAVEVMNMIYEDSGVFAFRSLMSPVEDFNNMTVVDLALIGNNKFFIAHPCCQRAIRERWLGMLRIRYIRNPWYRLPDHFKIFCCLVFVFPIYFWLSFDPALTAEKADTEMDSDVETSVHSDTGSRRSVHFTRKSFVDTGHIVYTSQPLWRKIQYLWTAPITKFWLNQYLNLVYLMLNGYLLLQPFCGRSPFPEILCLWTIVICCDNILRTISLKKKFPTMSVFWVSLDICTEIIICLFFIVIAVQVYFPWNNFMTYMELKLMLSLGLLTKCYRTLGTLLPVSSNLGPMMINITTLTRVDMINWFRLWGMCLLSGGFALTIAIYPAKKFNLELILDSVFRGALAIFLTEKDDIEEGEMCSSLYERDDVKHTCYTNELNSSLMSRLEPCPLRTWTAYVILIQFLAVTRCIFYVLMFAMFSVTIAKTKERSLEIWKYQFYFMVTDYEARSVVPTPLTVLTYPFRIMFLCGKLVFAGILECQKCCSGLREAKQPKKRASIVPYNQWKSYLAVIESKEEEKKTSLSETLDIMEDVMITQKRYLKSLHDRLVHVEQNQTKIHLSLETMMTELESLDPQVRATMAVTPQNTHTASRSSPYPGTDLNRFAVFEKNVPWDVRFEVYDPVIYSKPESLYPLDIQPWIDKDLLGDQDYQSVEQDSEAEEFYQSFFLPDPVFNTVQVLTVQDGKREIINRISYMMAEEEEKPLVYDIDAMGLPINPLGRTGMRGRGALTKWGPNHTIQAVISRWKTIVHSGSSKKEDQTSDKDKELEILLVKHDNKLSLPGASMDKHNNPYGELCDRFITDVLKESNTESRSQYDQDDMIEFFSQFASLDSRKKRRTLYANFGYSSFLVFRGYVDSALNTDNAWQEAEIWNFHYKHRSGFENRLSLQDKDGDHDVMWQAVHLALPKLTASESAAVLETITIHDSPEHIPIHVYTRMSTSL